MKNPNRNNRAPIEKIKEAFNYDPLTGIVTRRIRRGNFLEGSIAGGPDQEGYIRIWFCNRYYRATNIIWALHYGKWPDEIIDHKDRNPSNNVISNLREATQSQNQRNRSANRLPTQTGVKGVVLKRGKYIAKIRAGKERFYLGSFTDLQEASDAYNAAALKRDSEFYAPNEKAENL